MRLLNGLAGFFSKDMAMDLGTANTLIYVNGEGIRSRSLQDGDVIAVGHTSFVYNEMRSKKA